MAIEATEEQRAKAAWASSHAKSPSEAMRFAAARLVNRFDDRWSDRHIRALLDYADLLDSFMVESDNQDVRSPAP